MRASEVLQLPFGATLGEIARTCIPATLKHFDGDERRDICVLGCGRKTLYNKLRAYRRERNAGMN